MPTKVPGSSIWRVQEGLERALRRINTADGFNMSPTVRVGVPALDGVQAGDLPLVAFEFGDMTPDVEQTGVDAPSHGLIRYGWPALVYGYVRTTGDARSLNESATALLLDVLAAIYDDETLPDGAGQGTVLLAQPGAIAWDMESFAKDGRGWFAAEFVLVFDVERSGTP
jgi:hypothetical protein